MKVNIEISGYWHAGTGKGEGPGADALVARDALELPTLPGRHLKGLIRHALMTGERLGHFASGTAVRLCGKPSGAATAGESAADARLRAAGAYATEAGALRIGSARLPTDWLAFAETKDGRRACMRLFRSIQSTKIEHGVVAQQTLRSIEVAVPMTLTAPVEGTLSADDRDALRRALASIRAVGGQRTRGLGRANLSLEG